MSRRPANSATRAAAPSDAEIAAAALHPTQLPTRDARGFELDGWGLPVNQLGRLSLLVDINMPDPVNDPDAWAAAGVAHVDEVRVQNSPFKADETAVNAPDSAAATETDNG